MFITANVRDQLNRNAMRSRHTGRRSENFPVLRIVSTDTGESWTLFESLPENRDLAYAIYDAGDGTPPLVGRVSLGELIYARSDRGQLLDIDRSFRPTRPLAQLYHDIRLAGRLPGQPQRPTRH